MKTTKVSLVITSVAVLAAVAHVVWPALTIDSVTVALIIVAVVPWLAPIFKSLEMPGGFKVEWQNQGTTGSPLLPQAAVSTPKDLSADARKILATLWKHQKQHFGDDYSKRWTFVVKPGSLDFPNYLRGLAELVGSGLVSIVPETWHSVLTNPGIEFCKKERSLDAETDTYHF